MYIHTNVSFLYSRCPNGTPSRIPLIRGSPAMAVHDFVNEHVSHQQSDSNSTAGSGFRNDNIGSGNNIADPDADTFSDRAQSGAFQVPITLILIILTSYIGIGTMIFSIWENWSVVDGAYFCFVTLSTIGFGDMVPKKVFHGSDIQLFICCAYLLLGLVLVVMSFTLLETQLIWKCRRIAIRLKRTKD